MPKYQDIKLVFIDAWEIFTSTIAINLYTASNIVFIRILTNNTVVGYFSGAQKIISSINGLISPITQAIYPYVSKLANNSKIDTLNFLRKVILVLGGGNLIGSILIFIFAEWIVGIQTMLVFGMKKQFNKILLSAAIINTIIVLPMIYFYQAIGVSISMTITEIFVTLTMYFVLKKNSINFIIKKY